MNGAIIAYDEGLMNGDRELAAALWRTFFMKKCTDYRKLEVLVHYVRVQVSAVCVDLDSERALSVVVLCFFHFLM